MRNFCRSVSFVVVCFFVSVSFIYAHDILKTQKNIIMGRFSFNNRARTVYISSFIASLFICSLVHFRNIYFPSYTAFWGTYVFGSGLLISISGYLCQKIGAWALLPIQNVLTISTWDDSIRKIGHQGWQLFLHTVMAFYAHSFLHSQTTWWTNSQLFVWWDLSLDPEEFQSMYPELSRFLLFQSCVYAWATLFQLKDVSSDNKDFKEYFFHHILTMIITTLASVNHITVGVMVLYIHDVSDIVLDVCKLCHFFLMAVKEGKQKITSFSPNEAQQQQQQQQPKSWQTTQKKIKNTGANKSSNVLLNTVEWTLNHFLTTNTLCLLAAWVYYRLYTLIVYILLPNIPYFPIIQSRCLENNSQWSGCVMTITTHLIMSTLAMMQIYWFYRICRIVYKLTQQNVAEVQNQEKNIS
jgi:hypothetical protein